MIYASLQLGAGFFVGENMSIKTVQQLKDEFAETDPVEYNVDLLDSLSAGATFSGLGHFTVRNNTYTVSNKLSIGSRTAIPFENGTLSTTRLSAQILDQGTPFADNAIIPYQVGASGIYRVNFKASSASNNNFFDISLDIGGSEGEIVEQTGTFAKGAATTTAFSFSDPFFCENTFVANGGTFYLDPNNTIEIWDITMMVIYTTYPAA